MKFIFRLFSALQIKLYLNIIIFVNDHCLGSFHSTKQDLGSYDTEHMIYKI